MTMESISDIKQVFIFDDFPVLGGGKGTFKLLIR
jgi:hypothetical protein